jgi:hypothetical protein
MYSKIRLSSRKLIQDPLKSKTLKYSKTPEKQYT